MNGNEIIRVHRQVKPRAGDASYRFRLSDAAVELLKQTAEKLNTEALYWSQSPLVRRAIRVYADHVSSLTTEKELNEERMLLEIARRGR